MTIVSTVLIICVSVLFGIYIACCSENETGMFQNPRYEKQKIEKWNGDVPKVQGNSTPIVNMSE